MAATPLIKGVADEESSRTFFEKLLKEADVGAASPAIFFCQ